MGVEVKVMQCWRCKAYGHRANDRECPLLLQGNIVIDSERQVLLHYCSILDYLYCVYHVVLLQTGERGSHVRIRRQENGGSPGKI